MISVILLQGETIIISLFIPWKRGFESHFQACQNKAEVDGLWELRNNACGWPLKKAGWNARGTCIVLCNYNKYCSKGRWLAGPEMRTV